MNKGSAVSRPVRASPATQSIDGAALSPWSEGEAEVGAVDRGQELQLMLLLPPAVAAPQLPLLMRGDYKMQEGSTLQ